jgi:hypothetical protein
MSFVLVAKPTSHGALFAQLEEREQRGEGIRGTWEEGTGRPRCSFESRSVANVPLTRSGGLCRNFSCDGYSAMLFP